MKNSFIAVTALLSSMLAHHTEAEQTSNPTIPADPGYTVTFGLIAEIGELPSSALLQLTPQSGKPRNCTATLIEDDIIITAAHCIMTKEGLLHKSADVRFRLLDREGYTSSMRVNFDLNVNIAVHDESLLDNGRWNNARDLAVIELPRTANSSKKRVVAMLDDAAGIGSSPKLIIAGWGLQPDATGAFNDESRVLMYTLPLAVSSAALLSKTGDIRVGQNITLDNGTVISMGSCHGDSGGQIMLVEDMNRLGELATLRLAAVTSAYAADKNNLPDELKELPDDATLEEKFARCSFKGAKTVGAPIPANRDWIESAIEKLRLAQ